MIWLGVIVLVVLLVVQGARERPHPLVPIVVAGVMSAGVWVIVVRTAALPRAMTATGGPKNDAHRQPLAFSPRAAWLLGPNTLVRISLPELKPILTLPLSAELSPVTGVAWNGHELLVAWFSETKKGSGHYRGSYGIAGDEGWLVPERPIPHDDAVGAAYWDPLARAFVLVSNAHAPGGTEVAYRTSSFTFLDAQGKELRTVANVGPEAITAFTGYCASEGDVVATTGSSTCRTKSPIEATSTWTCERDPSGAMPMCPNHLNVIAKRETWIAAGGPARHPTLPASLVEKGFAGGNYLGSGLTLRETDVELREVRTAPDDSKLLRVDDGYVLIRQITDVQAKALGHTAEYELALEHYDAQGRLAAQGEVLGTEGASWLLPSASEIAILSPSLDTAARFDRRTMRRIDNPSVVTAVRERLERWGGPSPLFRALAQLTLALGPLTPLAIMAWILASMRSSARSMKGLTWTFSAFAIAGSVALAMTITRFYHL